MIEASAESFRKNVYERFHMKKFTGFEHGMGIGGWLTNYKRFNVLPDR